GCGAVADHGVVAVLAFDGVAAVAGVPDEPVVAGAEEGDVVAAVAVDRVVAVPTEEKLRAGSPGERVVPVASCDFHPDAGGDGTRSEERRVGREGGYVRSVGRFRK